MKSASGEDCAKECRNLLSFWVPLDPLQVSLNFPCSDLQRWQYGCLLVKCSFLKGNSSDLQHVVPFSGDPLHESRPPKGASLRGGGRRSAWYFEADASHLAPGRRYKVCTDLDGRHGHLRRLGYDALLPLLCLMWVWLKIEELRLRRLSSLVPFTKVPFQYHFFEPQPYCIYISIIYIYIYYMYTHHSRSITLFRLAYRNLYYMCLKFCTACTRPHTTACTRPRNISD